MALSNITANKLLRNDGGAFVEDPAAGIGRPLQQADTESITWGGGFHDLNLDGWEDLYLAAGNFRRASPRSERSPTSCSSTTAPASTFLDVSAATGADDPATRRVSPSPTTTATGGLDLFVVNQGGRAAPAAQRHAHRRRTTGSQVDTVGTVSNRDGCGARVVATTGDGDADATGDVRLDQRRVGEPDDRPLRPRLAPTSWTSSRSCGRRASASDSTDVDVDRVVAVEEARR